MSLLATASPYISGNENNDNDIASRRQQSHNRTLKQRKNTNISNDNDNEEEVVPVRPNVAAMMKALNNIPDEDGTGLADFNPPAKGELTKVPNNNKNMNMNVMNNNVGKQGFTNLAQAAPYEYDANNISNENQVKHLVPKANDDRAIDLSKYNSLPSNYANAYYQQLMTTNSNLQSLQNIDLDNYQILNERLNHIIHLLEEQQNSKTANVTEELILYCFLGVFVIFIVDSFARVGKYSR